MTEIDSPFKGLAAFEDSELDALLFFGRERDAKVIEANLVASRLTVLYGSSGVGKSSVVRAAVARSLRALREEPLVVVWSRWGHDAVSGVADAVADAAGIPHGPLADVVERAQQLRPLYLILDQAEEYFVYHGNDESFERELADIVDRHLQANVLLVVRDDALAGLDRFRRHLPAVFGNVLGLGRLDRAAGEAAIVRPVERFEELTGDAVGVEPALVERVLDEVTTGRIEHGLGGEGTASEAPADGIETPYLQLVMQRIWEAERAVDSDLLRLETLERLGGARKIVGDNLEGAMAELTPRQRAIAAAMFTHLVTPSGQKVAHRPSDLAELAGVSQDDATAVLRALDERRVLRSHEGGRFEIFHDVLASEILDWRRRFAADEALARERQEASRRHRALLLITAGALAAAVAATALTVWALVERGNASEQARRAHGRELDATAVSVLHTDPELGMLLATQGARLSPSLTAEDVLRRAILASHLLQSLPAGGPVTDVAVPGRRIVSGTTTGAVRIFGRGDDGAYARERSLRVGGYVRQVDVNADAASAATVSGSLTIVTPSGTTTRSVPGPVGGAILVGGCSSDAGCLVVGSRRELRVLDAATGAVARTIGVPARVDEIVAVRGGLVAVRSAGKRAIWLVDVRTGRTKRLSAKAPVSSIGASRRLVAAGLDDGTTRVWDTTTGRPVASRKSHVNSVLALAVAGNLVLSGAAGGSAQAWDVRERTVTAPPGGHNNLVVAADITGDAAYAVTGSLDRTARVWRTKDGYVAAELIGHHDGVRDVSFADGGARVVTGSTDGTIGVWDAATVPDLRVTRESPPPPPRTTARAEDGTVATVDDTVVRVRQPSGRTLVLRGHRNRITSVAFSADGARLVTASADHDARIWDARTGRLLQLLTGHFGAVADARFSPDGRWVVTAGPITAGLWNTRTGELVRYLRGPRSQLTAAAFADDRTIVTSEVDGTTRNAVCAECGSLDELVAIADARLERTGRELTSQERERYLG